MITNRAITPRLPGVFFPSRTTPSITELPPLDVAAFVGFAERGPLDLPVMLEDMEAFAAIFGGELPLARDTGEGVVVAQLASAIADFFTNGGRRCYAVRVATRPAAASGSPPATSARYTIPGLAMLDPLDLSANAAQIDAASPGRWAERLALAAHLEATPLPIKRFSALDGQTLIWDTDSAPAALRRGDLLRLRYTDGSTYLVPISDIVRPANPLATTTLELDGVWQILSGLDILASVPSSARLLGLGAPIELTLAGPLQPDGTELSLVVANPATTLMRGDLIELMLPNGRYLFGVQTVRKQSVNESPPEELFELRGSELLTVTPTELPSDSPLDQLHSIERLRLGLQLRLDTALRPLLGDLGLGAGHPRFWGDMVLRGSSLFGAPDESSNERRWLVSDQGSGTVRESQLRPTPTPDQMATAQFRELAAGRRPLGELDRVALAALLAPIDALLADHLFLPIGMPSVLTNDDLRGPAQAGSDGLTQFEAETFFDPHLRPLQVPSTLMSTARERYDVQELRLLGLHSLLVIEEVALIAAPDANHRPWGTPEPAPLPDLHLAPPVAVEQPCAERLGPFIDCERAPILLSVSPSHGPLDGGITVAINGANFEQQGELRVFFGGRPASNIVVIGDTQLLCTLPAGVAPEAVDVRILAQGGDGSLADGFTYLAPATTPDLPPLLPTNAYDLTSAPLLDIQRVLLTICQARQDALALLALPMHFTRRECIAWQQALRAALGLPIRRLVGSDTSATADLSYAAVFHPWLQVSAPSAPGRMRAHSPEGAVAGIIATRERERGVWVAPANQPFSGVLGLIPKLTNDDWAELFALQFNVLQQEARDFRAMSAHTLSDERSLLQISVRRLLILLRKAALNLGMDFVFLSNHEQFREGARALLNRMLQGMYERGAFAGSTPEQAYRVDTGPNVNTPQSIDQGRFIAEIQIAPSQPTEFISVVLTNANGQLQAAESR